DSYSVRCRQTSSSSMHAPIERPGRLRRSDRTSGAARTQVCVEQVQRPTLRFNEYATDVFSNDSQSDQLDAGEKQDRYHHRGIPWPLASQQYGPTHDEGCVADRSDRGQCAEVSREFQGSNREGRDAFNGEVPQSPIVPFALACKARVAIVKNL